MSLEETIDRHEHPIIGIIGALSPSQEYDNVDGFRIGYELRNIVNNGGSLFTGGVPGVGLDAYKGIVSYCKEKGVNDKFFVLVPETIDPTQEYIDLAKQTKNGVLDIERLGRDYEERRSYLGSVADLLIVVNGSTGTLDEGLKGLLLGKQVICLESSGGAAEFLAKFKRGEIEGISLDIDQELIRSFDSVRDIVNYLSKEYFPNLPKWQILKN